MAWLNYHLKYFAFAFLKRKSKNTFYNDYEKEAVIKNQFS